MSTPLICYVLVGVPGSGKSTLAKLLSQHNPDYQVVSTDSIREELFGDASIQGNWEAIEEKVLAQIQQSIAAGRPIIYDATNYKRTHRIDLLNKLIGYKNVYWVAWYLQTPLSTCLAWNQKRSRQVPEVVITSMFQQLQNFPPIPAEGLTAVYPVQVTGNTFNIEKITPTIKQLARTVINRNNRTKNVILHRYSSLLDFERLMHLIALLKTYPGVGNLQTTDPQTLTQLLGYEPKFATSIDEICALMSKSYTALDADYQQIATDIIFLSNNGISSRPSNSDIIVPGYTDDSNNLIVHMYSDLEVFKRLIKPSDLSLIIPY